MVSDGHGLDYPGVAPGVLTATLTAERTACAGLRDVVLLEAVRYRVSVVNGCAFCVDLHRRRALAAGLGEGALSAVASGRYTGALDERTVAALRLAEALTAVDGTVASALGSARAHFADAEVAALVAAVAYVNAWNRLALTGDLVPR